MREIRCAIELREDIYRLSPGRITGTLIEAGRVASDRREVFAPGALTWPQNGVRLLSEHRGAMVMRFRPIPEGSALRIDEPLPDTTAGRQLAAEIRSGRKRGLSIEFFSHLESVVSGVREIRSATIEAAAVVGEPAYQQANVEVRSKRKRLWL